jgi:DNA-3-methyladenine glycosylase I
VAYHDTEWGVPVHDEKKMFEMLLLESFQAGLSWITILHKRQHFYKRFKEFDPEKVAGMTDQELEAALNDKGIVRNRLKVFAARRNAQAFLDIASELGSFCRFLWEYVAHQPIQNNWQYAHELPSETILSERISKDLKKRGFQFMGSTVVYAHMQATGMVNDHLVSCHRHKTCGR